ncbi:MAG: hypothetical protein K6U09_09925 [Acidobacteriia bacterium]|nr:hypothetical protein [Terriglobia bacterium]
MRRFPGIVPKLTAAMLLVAGVAASARFDILACSLGQRIRDSAEISARLLYHPARAIEFQDAVLFHAEHFTYRWDRQSQQWQVQAEDNSDLLPADSAIEEYDSERLDALFQFFGETDEERAVLEIHRSLAQGGFEVLARLTLWDRSRLAAAWLDYFRQDAPDLSLAQLAEDLVVARPEVAAVLEDGSNLWLGIRYDTSQGALGLGTVVRVDTAAGKAEVFQPEALLTSSVTHLARFDGRLWLGARRFGEDELEPTVGLAELDPQSGRLRSHRTGSGSGFLGHVVTAMAGEDGALWVGTDEGICVLSRGRAWSCWRIVPVVILESSVAASNFPRGPAVRSLAPGPYEVRWATEDFLEIVTPDAVEGWARADEVAEFERRNFYGSAFELANTSAGGAGILHLLPTLAASPLESTQVVRIPVERVGPPESDGWQRCRARAGWIPSAGLSVVPHLSPVQP